MFHFYQFLLFVPLRTCFPARFYGRKNLPKGPCIIASNHTSNLDGPLLGLHTWEKKYYLAKKELFSNWASSHFYKGLGCIMIDRSKSDVNAVKNCLRVLKDGKKLVVFPEGTRNNNENMEMGEFKHGVALFATKAKVPIVPMFIAKKPRFFRRSKFYFGQPFELEEFYGKKLSNDDLARASEIVEQKINDLREKVLNSLTKK